MKSISVSNPSIFTQEFVVNKLGDRFNEKSQLSTRLGISAMLFALSTHLKYMAVHSFQSHASA